MTGIAVITRCLGAVWADSASLYSRFVLRGYALPHLQGGTPTSRRGGAWRELSVGKRVVSGRLGFCSPVVTRSETRGCVSGSSRAITCGSEVFPLGKEARFSIERRRPFRFAPGPLLRVGLRHDAPMAYAPGRGLLAPIIGGSCGIVSILYCRKGLLSHYAFQFVAYHIQPAPSPVELLDAVGV